MSVALTILVCVAGVIVPGVLALILIGSPLLSIVIALVAFVIEIPCVVLLTVIWPQQQVLKRRLNQVAAGLKGGAPTGALAEAQVSVFREQRSKSRLVVRLERRFSMTDVSRVLPKAVGLGVVAALAGGPAASFAGFGPAGVGLLSLGSGLGGCWAALALHDAGQRAAFTKVFPEINDQIVRLVQAGVPAVEAITIVAKEVPTPVDGVMGDIAAAVAAGLDPETAIRGTAARVRIPAFSLFSAAVCLQMTVGGGISGALGNLSATLRAREALLLKAKGATSQTRLTLAIIAVVPVVVLSVQNFTNPQVIETLLYTETGGTLLRYGVGCIVGGLLVAHSLSARIGR